MSKATKRKSKASPVIPEGVVEEVAVNLVDTTIPEVVEIVKVPESSLEPSAEISIKAIAPVIEPMVEAIVEPNRTSIARCK